MTLTAAPKSIKQSGHFDLAAVANAFPEAAETMLLDTYLTQSSSASTRVFRVYRPTPAHYHALSDEQLYVLSGQGSFWMTEAANTIAFRPGSLLVFPRNTVHAMPKIDVYPVIFLAIDSPPRQPTDVIFINPAEGTPRGFIRDIG